MMRKNITRTLTKATIHPCRVKIVDDNPVVEMLDPVVAWGKPTDAEAVKAVKEQYGKDATITIAKIEMVEETYAIPVEIFVEFATKIEAGEEAYEDTDSVEE